MRRKNSEDPFERFREVFDEAVATGIRDPNAMIVSSVDAEGRPSSRAILLKDFDADGFVFYTNFESRKGRHLLAQPKAAALFHWKSLRRQVRIEGAVQVVDDEEADAYFATRHKDSQIGAWASKQSRPLDGRFALEKEVARYAAKFALGRVPRPPFWSGFRILPQRIEFWHEGAFRLHDRLVYHRQDDGWRTERLFP